MIYSKTCPKILFYGSRGTTRTAGAVSSWFFANVPCARPQNNAEIVYERNDF
jgi:hypothetical protein